MMHFSVSTMLVFSILIQLCSAAILNLQCGNSKLHCPGDVQHFTCAIESGSLEWKGSIFLSDIEFFGSLVGTVINEKEFSANVTNKTGSLYMISVLSFPSNSFRTGVAIFCRDLNEGDTRTCIINTTYPSERILNIVLHLM